MKNTKIKGFSLAEVMIAMLVISIALAAAIPTITKRNAGSDNIWRAGTQTVGGATEEDANTLAFTGPNILIGASRLPLLSNDRYFANNGEFEQSFYNGLRISPKDDKLIIFKEIDDPADRFKSSHIGLYNSPTEYAGRLASDKYNLALGIGTLQSLQPDYSEAFPQGAYNTAIGQYALLTNEIGSYNTAFGYNALKGNGANINTSDINISGNIALGYNTLMNVENGSNNNIAIGSDAGRHIKGSNNILIGAGAGNLLTGSDNILITVHENFFPDETQVDDASFNHNKYDVKTLLRAGRDSDKYPIVTDNDNFAIGILNRRTTLSGDPFPPIMQGFTQTRENHKKGLIINTDSFNVKTRAGRSIFSVWNNDGQGANPIPITIVGIPTVASMPCNGAPVCLAKFNIPTASFYTNDVQTDFIGNNYDRKSDFPRFRGNLPVPEDNHTGLQNNPIFDLFIGSFSYGITIDYEDDETYEDKEDEIKQKFNEQNSLKPIGNDPAFYSNYLIDVGKLENNDSLVLSRYSDERSDDLLAGKFADAARPEYVENENSLKIRTVKTAVNFLDEMKEKSNWIDIMLLAEEHAITNIFDRDALDKLDTVSPCNSSGTPSNWESVMECDPVYYQEDGKNVLAKFCNWNYKNEQRTENLGEALKNCIAGRQAGETYIGCIIREYNEMDEAVVDLLEQAAASETSSDARLKNIAGDNTAGLDEINKLQVYNYTYKADKAQTPHVGVMAQDLKKVFPNAVKKGSDGYYRIRLEDMFYAMVNSVKELTKKKDELNALTVDYIDAPLSELEKQNADIKAQNELLKQKNEEIEKRLSQMEAK